MCRVPTYNMMIWKASCMRVNSSYCYYEEEHTFTWEQFELIKAVSLHVHPCMYKMGR